MPQVLDALARLDPEQRHEAFRRAEFYEARTPAYVLSIVDSLETWGPMLAPAPQPTPRPPRSSSKTAMTRRCWPAVRRALLSFISLADRHLGPEKTAGGR